MSPINKQAYIKSGGVKCPFCGEAGIAGGAYDTGDAGVVTQEVCCDICERTWTDIFTLTGVVLNDED